MYIDWIISKTSTTYSRKQILEIVDDMPVIKPRYN